MLGGYFIAYILVSVKCFEFGYFNSYEYLDSCLIKKSSFNNGYNFLYISLEVVQIPN